MRFGASRRIRLLAVIGAFLVIIEQTGGGQPAGGPAIAPTPGWPVRIGRLAHPAIRESSGIVSSRKQAGTYWTMNDSGNPPRLYAVDATGRSLGVLTIAGARNVDWEDIAIDEDGKLYVGDFGNNSRRRRVLTIYVIPEPDPRKAARAAVEAKVRFRYPDGHGPFDCEAMFVRKGRAYLITKQPLSARLYRVRLDGPANEIVEAEYLGLSPHEASVTGADLSADRRSPHRGDFVRGIQRIRIARPPGKALARGDPRRLPACPTAPAPVDTPTEAPLYPGPGGGDLLGSIREATRRASDNQSATTSAPAR